jgi:hypothetical protein
MNTEKNNSKGVETADDAEGAEGKRENIRAHRLHRCTQMNTDKGNGNNMGTAKVQRGKETTQGPLLIFRQRMPYLLPLSAFRESSLGAEVQPLAGLGLLGDPFP